MSAAMVSLVFQPHCLLYLDKSAGDVELNSWFEGGSLAGRIDKIDLDMGAYVSKPSNEQFPREQADWWRMLSLKIANFSAGIFNRVGDSIVGTNDLNSPLDLTLIFQKSKYRGAVMSRCRVSLVNMTLKYSQYCQLYAVMKENIGSYIDREKWDNIEKAYDLEVKATEEQFPHPNRVEYASGARHVRFGTRSQLKQQRQDGVPDTTNVENSLKDKDAEVDMQFTFDGFSLKLRRDDPVDVSAFEYDMVLLRVLLVEASISNKASEDFSFQLSLYRIGLFDLGDHGRKMFNKERNLPEARLPCAFSVLVEDYSNVDDSTASHDFEDSKKRDDAQLVVTVDRVPASSLGTIGSPDNPVRQQKGDGKVMVAKVVLNFLSVNALIRPFKELGAFLALSWPSPKLKFAPSVDGANVLGDERKELPTKKKVSSYSCLQVKLVAHYPRIFFVAEENDPHSRALVLRGYVPHMKRAVVYVFV